MQTGRIVQEHKTNYLIATDEGELNAFVRGVFHERKDFPKVGDYVSYTNVDDDIVIEEVLPRKTEIVRTSQARNKHNGAVKSEILVTNVDVIFIVMGLDQDFNVSRIERYVSLAVESNVRAVILLNKCDVVPDVTPYVTQLTHRLPDIPVHAVSAASDNNLDVMLQYLTPETTAVLLGSSGAGKSTITNRLLQKNVQATQNVREEDSRGRHTTTSRQLFRIPTGGFLIDTPGVRELGVVGETEDVFTIIESLARQCKFSDCDHEKSTGCAIQEAVKAGEIPAEQLANYLKLRREHEYIASKTDKELERRYHDNRKKQAQYGQKVIRSKYKTRGVK